MISIKGHGLSFFLIAALLQSQTVFAEKLPAEVLEKRCVDVLVEKAGQFHVVEDQWRRFVDTHRGARVYRAPSDRIGYWFELQVPQKDLPVAAELSARERVYYKVDKNCTLTRKDISAPQTQQQDGFTDEALIQFAQENPDGAMVVSWSTGMPLSLPMIKNALEVSEQLQIPIQFVLDPQVDVDRARKLLQKNGLSEHFALSLNSFELMMQGITTHYPSFIFLQDGRIASPMFPGLSSTNQLMAFVHKYAEDILKDKIETVLSKQNIPIDNDSLQPKEAPASDAVENHSWIWLFMLLAAVLFTLVYILFRRVKLNG